MEEAITAIDTPPRVDQDDDDDDNDDSSNDDLDGASLPLSTATIHYTVTKPGPFLSRHIIPNSHTGRVSFVPSYHHHRTSDNDDDDDDDDDDEDAEDDDRLPVLLLRLRVEFNILFFVLDGLR